VIEGVTLRVVVRSSVQAALALLLPDTLLVFFAVGFRLFCALGVVLLFNQLGVLVGLAGPVYGTALGLGWLV